MRRVVLFVLALAVLAACLPSGFRHIDPSYSGVLITSDASVPSDEYNLTAQGGTPLSQVEVSADATNTSGNLRAIFFPTGQVPTNTGQVCATWNGPNAPDDLPQQGLAARVETNSTGTRRAITVTKNIFGTDPARAVQYLNINLWTLDNANPANDVLNTIPLDYASVLAPGGVLQPFPWRVCARVTGATVSADVAVGTTPAAPFADPTHVQTATLPNGWDYPGQFGWYIGHLHGGMTFDYTNLTATTP